jgi:ADP-ribose pyrophosphatase
MSEKDYLYQGWLKVFRRQRKGRKYDILEAPSGIAALMIDDKERVLLVEQYRPAVEKKTWEIPAGCLDKLDKSPVEILVEEIEEECELNIESEDLHLLISYIPQIGHNYSTMEIYLARVPIFEETERDVEDVDVERIRWWPMQELGHAIKQGDIQDAKTVLAYYCYQEMNRPCE